MSMMALVILLIILLIVAGAGCVHYRKGREYWRRLAMAEAKKRLEKDSEQEKVRQAIDRAAAKMISAKDKEIADLQERLRYKTCVNERLWTQLREDSTAVREQLDGRLEDIG